MLRAVKQAKKNVENLKHRKQATRLGQAMGISYEQELEKAIQIWERAKRVLATERVAKRDQVCDNILANTVAIKADTEQIKSDAAELKEAFQGMANLTLAPGQNWMDKRRGNLNQIRLLQSQNDQIKHLSPDLQRSRNPELVPQDAETCALASKAKAKAKAIETVAKPSKSASSSENQPIAELPTCRCGRKFKTKRGLDMHRAKCNQEPAANKDHAEPLASKKGKASKAKAKGPSKAKAKPDNADNEEPAEDVL